MPFYRHEENDLDSADKAGFTPEDVARAVFAFGGYMVTKGMEVAIHEHRKAQLVLTLRGMVRCEADQSVWIVPPRCAVWIPGNLPHSVTVAGNVEVYCLFVEPDAAPALPRQCCTLSISPLLERLLLHVTRMPVLYDVDGADGRIATVLLDQLSLAPVEKLNFPMPIEAKLRKIATAMMTDPSDRATIDDWGRRIAVAPRTLTRALKRETGMSFGRWRRQLHILIAHSVSTKGPRSRPWRSISAMRARAPSSPCSARPWASRPPGILRNAASSRDRCPPTRDTLRRDD